MSSSKKTIAVVCGSVATAAVAVLGLVYKEKIVDKTKPRVKEIRKQAKKLSVILRKKIFN